MLLTANLKATKTGIRCDRSTFLGNPFDLKNETDRGRVCDGFKKYLWAIVGHGHTPVRAADAIALCMGLPISPRWQAPTTAQFLSALKRIEQAPDGTKLLCWCAPLRCHCDEYVSYREWVEQTIEIEGL